MADNEKAIAVGVGVVGVAFAWSALRGKSFLSVIQNVIRGKSGTKADPLVSLNTGGGLVSNTTGAAVAPSGAGEKAFFVAVLTSLGAPPTTANLNSLTAWAGKESVWPGGPGKGGTYNPFNTTLNEPGASAYNSVGVRNYPNAAEGVLGTVATLEGGYPSIVSALRSGRGLCGNGNLAGDFSKWSGGGYTSVC